MVRSWGRSEVGSAPSSDLVMGQDLWLEDGAAWSYTKVWSEDGADQFKTGQEDGAY